MSHTSTGRTGGPGSGDYRSDEAGTGTWSEVGKKTKLSQGEVEFEGQRRMEEHGVTETVKEDLRRNKKKEVYERKRQKEECNQAQTEQH